MELQEIQEERDASSELFSIVKASHGSVNENTVEFRKRIFYYRTVSHIYTTKKFTRQDNVRVSMSLWIADLL